AFLSRIPTDENSINVVTDIDFTDVYEAEGDIVLTYESFLNEYKRTSYHVGETSVSYNFSKPLVSGGSYVYVLNFKMRAEDEAAMLTVNFGIEHTYHLTTEWREFYVPCTKGEIRNIKLEITTPFQKAYLTDVNVYKYDPLWVNASRNKNGSYSVDGIPMHYISEYDGIGVGQTMDVTGDGEYLYTAGNETLKILNKTSSGTALISSVKGIGNVRHIELRDNKHLAVASRETGVYIVNIENKTTPFIESYYDSLEFANDVCFSGNYMFVAGRYFGVEIVDISDIKTPKFINRIFNDKECFRCLVDGQYLYVSCWATGEVEVYDISDLNEPLLISSIPVEGRCAEIVIEDKIAYIVSGYNNFNNADNCGEAGYGTGNALNIYDITNIDKPVWKSTIKTEGNLYGNGYDDWSVKVSNGYAYFTNSFGGMYIYNVKNVTAPIAVMRVAVSIPNTSSNFVDLSKHERGVYPYDIKEEIYSPIMSVYVDNGRVFFACASIDVYSFEFEQAVLAGDSAVEGKYSYSERELDTDGEYEVYLPHYDVYALVKYDDMYVAATQKGLLLLDGNFEIISEYATSNPVKDVKITSKGFIVTAEKFGIAMYKLENNSFVRTSILASQVTNRNVSSIGVTGDGKFVITQSSWTRFEAINIQNPSAPQFVTEVISKKGSTVGIRSLGSVGNMYYRNIVTDTVDGCVGIGSANSMMWFESKDGGLHVKNSYSNKFYAETNGSVALGENTEVLSVYNNGYVVYNPLKANENLLNKAERYFIPNIRLKGKVGSNGKILAVCNFPSGNVYILNISDYTSPYLMRRINLKNSPGIPLVENNYVLIPARHGGIVKVTVEQ
ncbi:MAG: hypothetical protein IJ300_13550, partial [Clostridia bacterium]|nr:hypothetical protein [Clostridia bacterium]